tara:strand:+ start:1252 stop:1659 length:408 start_codon:yes stop_codon:yes gene_type:complete
MTINIKTLWYLNIMDNIVSLTLVEKDNDNSTKIPTYEELVKEVDLAEMLNNDVIDDIISQEIYYDQNFTKKELDKIAEYYNIEKRKKKKMELIESIVEFESDKNNIELVFKRKKLWSYISEIKEDKYLSRYLIFD